MIASTTVSGAAIPSGALPAIAVVCVVIAAFAIAFDRIRRVETQAAADARLAEAVRADVVGGRIPEARDRLRRESGPLARVLLAIFRFPYGVHREAVDMAWSEALEAEGRVYRPSAAPIPILGALALVIGVASDLSAGVEAPLAGTSTLLGVLGAGASVGVWARLRRVAGDSAGRVEAASAQIAVRIVEFSESPNSAEVADAIAAAATERVAVGAGAGGNRP